MTDAGSESLHSHRRDMGQVDEILKRELNTSFLKATGAKDSGSISDGAAFSTDSGTVFVKFNSHPEAAEMFKGEYHGLLALRATRAITVPKPIKYIKNPHGGAMLVLDYMPIRHITSKNFPLLGEQAARLHLHNSGMKKLVKRQEQTITGRVEDEGYVDMFGFPMSTHAGYFPQDNGWMDNWVDFFSRKLEKQVCLTEDKHNDRDARPVFAMLERVIPKLFSAVTVEPALLHGDLWRGNIGETDSGPVSFDPICFYGHDEFEISIARVHKGFEESYFNSYHSFLPKQPGFQDRLDLYLLYHYFQLWNHHGPAYNPEALLGVVERDVHAARFDKGYKESTLQLMQDIIKRFSP
ncbi:ketosamine-3-kinase [Aplysia californica]|uniref:protein-ribulosamine 3-kinase n=1 Tax=Aplysia californica TaxID=6500 RepID=A0ABM0JLS2_APLCA|nr:ketosamine-3-kinase [Aplysia californica]